MHFILQVHFLHHCTYFWDTTFGMFGPFPNWQVIFVTFVRCDTSHPHGNLYVTRTRHIQYRRSHISLRTNTELFTLNSTCFQVTILQKGVKWMQSFACNKYVHILVFRPCRNLHSFAWHQGQDTEIDTPPHYIQIIFFLLAAKYNNALIIYLQATAISDMNMPRKSFFFC